MMLTPQKLTLSRFFPYNPGNPGRLVITAGLLGQVVVVGIVAAVPVGVVDVLWFEKICSFSFEFEFSSFSSLPALPLLASRVARTATMTTTAIPVKLATNLNRR